MLTELQVKGSKPKEKKYMLRDDRGLYLRVDPSGRKYWILRYWEQKKERPAAAKVQSGETPHRRRMRSARSAASFFAASSASRFLQLQAHGIFRGLP